MNDEQAIKAIAVMMLLKPVMEKHIHPLLKGHGPEVQSAAIADLAALYLAGCAPSQRPMFRQMLIELMDDLVAPNERLLFGDRGHPARWN
jgi:hypothetical protein